MANRSAARRGTLLVPPPPRTPAAAGHAYYLPEYYYLFEIPRFPADRTARVTALAVARWSTGYRARSLSDPQGARQGPLPTDPSEREAETTRILDWIEQATPTKTPIAIGLNLYQGGLTLLNQYDGFPGVLMLMDDNFATLQDVWRQEGLPADIYYPAAEQRQIVEPTAYAGGVVRMLQRYTPRYWSDRNAVATRPLPVANEDERRTAFAEACRRFLSALSAVTWPEPPAEFGASTKSRAEFERLRDLTMRIYSRYGGGAASHARHRRATPVVRGQQDKALLAACSRFAKAILLREAELNEPGKVPDRAELADLSALMTAVAEIRTGSGDVRMCP